MEKEKFDGVVEDVYNRCWNKLQDVEDLFVRNNEVFWNIKGVAGMMGISCEEVIMTRYCTAFQILKDSLEDLRSDGEVGVEDEGKEDWDKTFTNLHNYLYLLEANIIERRDRELEAQKSQKAQVRTIKKPQKPKK